MNDTQNWQDKGDVTILEKVNPVFHTAKMTLFQLAANGDPDAALLTKNLSLEFAPQKWMEAIQSTVPSKTTKEEAKQPQKAGPIVSPEQLQAGKIVLEIRYLTMASLAEKTGYTLVDMPCGYTPRGMSFARKGLPYYGLNLPVVIREIKDQVLALLTPEEQRLVHFQEVDATNHASLEKALEDIQGQVCILTEGLLMYFTDSELGVLCDNIRSILEKKGGCWYTADPESAFQYAITIRALMGDRFEELMKNARRDMTDRSDVNSEMNTLIISPGDMEGNIEKAKQFFEKHGLRAERIPVGEVMPQLQSLSQIPPQQAQAIREGMKEYAFWKLTVSGSRPGTWFSSSEMKGFEFDASIQEGTLLLDLKGRLDTITAPSLLAFFEKSQKDHPVEAVVVDCAGLDYISSAGLRVLMILHKACQGGTSLRNTNDNVKDILEQTGFDQLFTCS